MSNEKVEVAEVPTAEAEGADKQATSEQWDNATKRMILVILLIALVFGVYLSRPVLPLLIFSGIVAYLLKPIVDLSERIRVPRAVSTLVLYLLLLVGISLMPIIFGPIIIDQLAALRFDPLDIVTALVGWSSQLFQNVPDNREVLGFVIPVGDWAQQLQQNYTEFQFMALPTLADVLTYVQQVLGTATSLIGSTATISLSVVGGIFTSIFSGIVIFVMSIYLTKDAPLIRTYIEELFPASYQPELAELMRRMGSIWQAFFRGQILLVLIIGVTTWASLTLIGMPSALILAIVAGMLEIVPNVGPVLAMIPAVIVALIQGSTNPTIAELGNLGFALITVGVYFIIQQLENSIIVPRVIGDSVNLHPVVVISGVIVGFSIAGILGAFLAAPVISSLRLLGGYIHAKLLDYPPFSKPATPLFGSRVFSYRRTVTGEELRAEKEQDVEVEPLAPIPEDDASADLADGNAAAPATSAGQ